MKYLALVVCILFISCDKDPIDPPEDLTGILGEWVNDSTATEQWTADTLVGTNNLKCTDCGLTYKPRMVYNFSSEKVNSWHRSIDLTTNFAHGERDYTLSGTSLTIDKTSPNVIRWYDLEILYLDDTKMILKDLDSSTGNISGVPDPWTIYTIYYMTKQ